jgi:hypothetical protein
MKEYEVHLRVRIKVEDMNEADECAEAIITDMLNDGEMFIDRPIEAAEWDRIVPIRNCRRKEGT